MAGLFILTILCGIYLLPCIIAMSRKHHNSTGITILTLFLGWTIIGWVGALMWALTDPNKQEYKRLS